MLLRPLFANTCRLLHTNISEMPTALLVLAQDAEESEAVITADILRRGDVQVTIAGCNSSEPVTCVQQTKIMPDKAVSECCDQVFDVVIIPGGPGSQKLKDCPKMGELLKKQQESGKLIAAICGAVSVLAAHKICADLVTCHPSVQKEVEEAVVCELPTVLAGYKVSEDRVVVSGKVVTSRGPGTAFEFAVKLVEMLSGAEKANSLKENLLLKF